MGTARPHHNYLDNQLDNVRISYWVLSESNSKMIILQEFSLISGCEFAYSFFFTCILIKLDLEWLIPLTVSISIIDDDILDKQDNSSTITFFF